MSTRFDAAGDRISFAGAMFAVGSGFTMTAWAWVSVDTNDNATFARLHASSGGSTVVTWATDSDGLVGPNYFTGGGSVSNATNMAVGAWRKIAISCSGTTGKSYVNINDGSTATESDSGTVGVGTPDGITLGGRAPGDAGESFNGRLVYVRVWTAELSQVQIEAEWSSATPVVTSGLWADWPLTDSTDLTDHSGNGRNLSAGTTAVSTEADPPLAANVTGTGSGAFGGLTAAASGIPTVSGSAAGSFGGLTSAASGTRKVLGTAALAGGGLTSTGTGTRMVIGIAAGQFGGLLATAVAPSLVSGTASTDFGGLTAAAQGSVPVVVVTGASGWWQLVSIKREAQAYAHDERTQPPTACPYDGVPLRTGPRGSLYCPEGNYSWPQERRII